MGLLTGGCGGATGRAGAGGGTGGLGGATGCAAGPGTGGATRGGGAVAGRGVPQYPQNLLPTGNDLWHFGHITWGIAGPPAPRKAVLAGAAGVGGAPVAWGFPQRAQTGADAGFMLPQEAQRMYRTVPCSFASAAICFIHPPFGFNRPWLVSK